MNYHSLQKMWNWFSMKCGRIFNQMGIILNIFQITKRGCIVINCCHHRGNVRLAEIDGPIVRLELQGACGTCPSSSMTMKMGLERRLKERIPEIAEGREIFMIYCSSIQYLIPILLRHCTVIQAIPDAPALNNENVETVLDGVRPFLSVAGGKISIQSISGVGGLQPVVTLKMDGKPICNDSN